MSIENQTTLSAKTLAEAWMSRGGAHKTFTRSAWQAENSQESYAQWLLNRVDAVSVPAPTLADVDFSQPYEGPETYAQNLATLRHQLTKLPLADASFGVPASETVASATGLRTVQIEELATLAQMIPPGSGYIKYQWLLSEEGLQAKPSMLLLKLMLENGFEALEPFTLDPEEWIIGALNGEIGVFFVAGCYGGSFEDGECAAPAVGLPTNVDRFLPALRADLSKSAFSAVFIRGAGTAVQLVAFSPWGALSQGLLADGDSILETDAEALERLL